MAAETTTITFKPIGFVKCLAKNKYDVARQGVYGKNNKAIIKLDPKLNIPQATEHLSGFSHIWVIFCFHKNNHWNPMVSPPTLEGKKVGVFASRSPYRPNPIGISAVRLLKITGTEIWVENHDFVDGTPVLDIKPYVTTSDVFPKAKMGWLKSQAKPKKVVIQKTVLNQLSKKPLIKEFVVRNLERNLKSKSKRIAWTNLTQGVLAYRYLRFTFQVLPKSVRVIDLKQSNNHADGEINSLIL